MTSTTIATQLMFNLTTPDLSVICTKHVSRSYYSYTYVVGSYTEDHENSQTVKIKGWARAQGWALARSNTVLGLQFIGFTRRMSAYFQMYLY